LAAPPHSRPPLFILTLSPPPFPQAREELRSLRAEVGVRRIETVEAEARNRVGAARGAAPRAPASLLVFFPPARPRVCLPPPPAACVESTCALRLTHPTPGPGPRPRPPHPRQALEKEILELKTALDSGRARTRATLAEASKLLDLFGDSEAAAAAAGGGAKDAAGAAGAQANPIEGFLGMLGLGGRPGSPAAAPAPPAPPAAGSAGAAAAGAGGAAAGGGSEDDSGRSGGSRAAAEAPKAAPPSAVRSGARQ
jgi:hypothetical protein